MFLIRHWSADFDSIPDVSLLRLLYWVGEVWESKSKRCDTSLGSSSTDSITRWEVRAQEKRKLQPISVRLNLLNVKQRPSKRLLRFDWWPRQAPPSLYFYSRFFMSECLAYQNYTWRYFPKKNINNLFFTLHSHSLSSQELPRVRIKFGMNSFIRLTCCSIICFNFKNLRVFLNILTSIL